MGVLLNIRNKVAPGSHLCADVEKLCDHREQEVWITEEVAKVSTVTGLIFVLTLNGGKFRPEDKHRPDECNRADDPIWLYNAQRFGTKISFVRILGLSNCEFRRRWFHFGKNN